MKQFIILIVCLLVVSQAAEFHLNLATTLEPHAPVDPYVFSYQAGRAPGHVDRSHTEISDGSGVVRGLYSYVNPKNELFTVNYSADEHGFHPELSHPLEDTKVVQAAKQRHLKTFHRIAAEHAAIGAALESLAALSESDDINDGQYHP